MLKSHYFWSSLSNICCIDLKFGTILRLIAIYLHIKFQVSTVSATCIFYTKNGEITLFFILASQIFSALT